uniref:Putative secreted protein n=1 Tax=Ixodes scapularis TaxID=6945 RepID=A0A4D5RC89_IXOSC
MKPVFIAACFILCVGAVCGRSINDDDKYNSPIPINPPPALGLPKHDFEEHALDDDYRTKDTEVDEYNGDDSQEDEVPAKRIGMKEAKHRREEGYE